MQANSRQLSAEHIMRRARTGCVREVVAFTGGRAAVLLCAEHCKRRRLRWAAAPWRTFARRAVEGPVAVASLYTGEEDRLCCWMWTRSSWLADSTSRMWTGALVPIELPPECGLVQTVLQPANYFQIVFCRNLNVDSVPKLRKISTIFSTQPRPS